MNIKATPLIKEAVFIVETKFGNLYFFKNFIITEIFEGMTIGKKEFEKIFNLCSDCFGNEKPFGIISHRIYSYSVNLLELSSISDKFDLVVANAVVAYTDISLKNFELEQQLLNFNGKFFNNLDSAIEWINNQINLD